MTPKKRLTIWRLWCYALGAKSGKNDKEANIVAIIRTFIFSTYLITNVAIVANAIRHWNDTENTQIYLISPHEVPSDLQQGQKEKAVKTSRNFL